MRKVFPANIGVPTVMLKEATDVKVGEVVEINGLKSVILYRASQTESVEVTFRRIIGRGKQLREDTGMTYLNKSVPLKSFGSWSGLLDAGAIGSIVNRKGEPVSLEGEHKMATKTAAAKRAAAKKSGAAKKKPSNRASNEELDEQAAEVVRLRDEEELSWGEVEEETGIPAGRLRALYNRGGGEPTKQRKGSAKAKPKPKADKKSSAKKGAAARKKATSADEDPSDED